MPSLPNYCDLTPEVNSVPSEADMVFFKPYFCIEDRCSSFEVHVRVPSECYEILSSQQGFPGTGSCTNAVQHNEIIKIDKIAGCESSVPKMLKQTLSYSQSDDGQKIYIYVQDDSMAGTIKGGSLSTRGIML